jgi:ADP-ribosyl-[dinitrogen reductase] hydrolase
MYGGDTDTNACIVGGLVGASVGVEQIPDHFVKGVLGCDTKGGRPRPDFLHPNQIPELVDKMLANAPSTITVVPDVPIQLK